MQRRSRWVSLIVVAALLAACSGTASPPASSNATQTPAGSAEPTPTPAATEEPTSNLTPEGVTPEPVEATASPTPAAAASNAKITQTFFKVWATDYGTYYQGIVEIENTGGGAADIGGGQDYTIFDKDGGVLVTDSFTYAFPRAIGPGQKGYLINTGTFDKGVKTGDVGQFDTSALQFSDRADGPTVLFKVSNVKVQQVSYGVGLQTSGVITNTTATNATEVIAGAVFFDSQGKIIGGLYANNVGNVAAGKLKGYKTSYPGTPPLEPAMVKKTVVIAFEQTYS
jgi:hypothetical protein